VPWADEDGVRAATARLGAAHRRVNPELSSHIVCCRDDPAPVRVAADDEWLRPELRALKLLDSGEEGVEVEVGEDHAATVRTGHDECLTLVVSYGDRRSISQVSSSRR
jgi:hypothetical protein